MISLVDGDILLYECGFSSDSSARKELMDKWGMSKGDDFTVEQQAELKAAKEPLPFALKIVKNKIEAILEVTNGTSYEMYITGKDNYRMEFLPDYKANRDPNAKPHWYKEIKEYLIDQHKGIVCDGEEADDVLGYRQMLEEEDTCICTKDKDLDCIPGLHYNWSPSRYERGVYDVTPLEALRFFYTQCITGDATDNIPGLYKLTGKRAAAKFKKVIAESTTALEMHDYINSLYDGIDWYPSAKCLWIRQEPNQMWEPPFGCEPPTKEGDQ